ncbi:iron ascorbate-dependent oxidoreductase [Aureococcus anophagefferens]|nr:iron ascorbate-dependent oxidoreductase [Aureococcus anophagefferens]
MGVALGFQAPGGMARLACVVASIAAAQASLQPKHRSAPPPPRPEALTDDDIPVLDIARLMRGEYDETDVRALGRACASPGFFHVVNHGVPAAVIANFEAAMRDFFARQTPEQKRRVKRTATNSRGYADDEFTKRTRDVKGDATTSSPTACRASRAPSRPTTTPARASATACSAASRRRWTWTPGAFDGLFGGGHTSYLRMNYYPPHAGARFAAADANLDDERLAAGAEDDQATPLEALGGPRLGVNRHFDAGCLTLLYQDPSCSALQVGDMLQVLSNGAYRAPEHRVLASAPGAERFSAPFFYNPAYDAEVRPLAGNAPRYGPFSYGDWRRRRFEGDFADEGKPEIQISDYLLE